MNAPSEYTGPLRGMRTQLDDHEARLRNLEGGADSDEAIRERLAMALTRAEAAESRLAQSERVLADRWNAEFHKRVDAEAIAAEAMRVGLAECERLRVAESGSDAAIDGLIKQRDSLREALRVARLSSPTLPADLVEVSEVTVTDYPFLVTVAGLEVTSIRTREKADAVAAEWRTALLTRLPPPAAKVPEVVQRAAAHGTSVEVRALDEEFFYEEKEHADLVTFAIGCVLRHWPHPPATAPEGERLTKEERDAG